MKPKHRRMRFLLCCLVLMAAGIAGILSAFSDNLVFFYTPTQLAAKLAEPDFDRARSMRIGGIVKQASVKNLKEGGIRFTITDLNNERDVLYKGMVPSLFREGQGVVAQGALDDKGVVLAENILAKHDENYMPREVVDALKASGRWKEDGGYQKQGTK